MTKPPQDDPHLTVGRDDRDDAARYIAAKSTSATNGSIVDAAGTLPRLQGADQRLSQRLGVGLIPGYEVTGEIARGGMGMVLSARDITLDREVAIKTLLPGVTGVKWALNRFLDEARITARLQHPGIPPVHQVGTLPDGRPYLAMKMIRGRTLANMLQAREQRINSQSASELELTSPDSPGLLHVFELICQAVGYAHSQGVIHRDLKPANVMVGKFGEVHVMDWGLAKSGVKGSGVISFPRPELTPHAGPSETRTGRTMGTPQYMPPEQARGEWEEVNSRADVFALGGILAAILTGQPPYTGAGPFAVLRRAEMGDLGECFARLDECGADEELLALAKRCLTPDAKDRPSNGAEVARQIAAYRLGVESRLMVAEKERAAADAIAEEARRRAIEERVAKRAAEERAQEAEYLTEFIRSQSRQQARRRRGIYMGFAVSMVILGAAYGNYRANKACERICCPPPCQQVEPCAGEREAAAQNEEHIRK